VTGLVPARAKGAEGGLRGAAGTRWVHLVGVTAYPVRVGDVVAVADGSVALARQSDDIVTLSL
jgi:hypothetical protein